MGKKEYLVLVWYELIIKKMIKSGDKQQHSLVDGLYIVDKRIDASPPELKKVVLLATEIESSKKWVIKLYTPEE